MCLAKMAFSICDIAESERRLLIFRRVGGDAARLFFPLFHHGGIAHDLDLALEIPEAHPAAEALFVEIAQLRLVTVMIGRTE